MAKSYLMTYASLRDKAYEKYISHFDDKYADTQAAIASTLRMQYGGSELTTCDSSVHDLIGFADAGNATISPLDPESHCVIRQVNRKVGLPGMILTMNPGVIRQDPVVTTGDSTDQQNENGSFSNQIKFGKYRYIWNDQEYLVYLVNGISSGRLMTYYYILCEQSPEDQGRPSSKAIDRLMHAASSWTIKSEGEILVFDQGLWGKDKELFNSVKSTSWDDVVLESSMKSSLVRDVEGFFDVKDIYKDLNVPWQVEIAPPTAPANFPAYREDKTRGIIFHGEPGNGKTLSLRALIHRLGERKPAIPTLYVKNVYGNQRSIQDIFAKARLIAPCLLVFEDIDSLIVDSVRSYFLNEVDGLGDNDGILIVATTNHLEKIDASLAHRPSRFDKKCHFACPKKPERILYCQYWRKLLSKKNMYTFPDALCERIADITEDFSFAYLKELFLSTLLGLARDGKRTQEAEDVENLEALLLWQRIQTEAELLRKDLSAKTEEEVKTSSGAGQVSQQTGLPL